MTPGEPKVTGAPPTDLHNYAHFGDGWYFCWLIERRDGPQPQWWSVGCEWTTDAWKALWYARREDADADADECPHDVVVCEHGFAVTGEDKTFDHAALSTRVRELEAALYDIAHMGVEENERDCAIKYAQARDKAYVALLPQVPA